ncbi:MAG: hypothetical protein J6Y78_11445 [Paludibacteraceae bacterium]|nr:hypothetical protein [Paludibacteraceae bacterium]
MKDINIAIEEMGLYEISTEELEKDVLNFKSGITVLSPKLLASQIAEKMFNENDGDKISTDEISFEVIFLLNEMIEQMESYVEEILDANGVEIIDE